MANSFEKVMQACVEAKKAAPATKKTTESKKATEPKKATESKKAAAKKTAKKVTEKKVTKKSLREEDEFLADEEELDGNAPEFDVDVAFDDPEAEYDDTMDDVADDIMVVIDPEIDAEDIDTVASELQDIIDTTPEGEIPVTDEYIDDFTYSCPVCGSTFFSPVEMVEGDECPVCNEVPSDGFVLAGQVAEAEELVADEEEGEEEPAEELDVDVTEEPDEELDIDVAETEVPEEDEKAEEAFRRARARRNATRKAEMNKRNRATAPRKRVQSGRKFTGYQLDETSFNPFMTKFIRENYKNARAYTMKSATYSKSRNALRVECVLTMKSGAKKRSVLTFEGFNPNKRYVFAKDTTNTFKCEGRTVPFRFAIRKVGNTIKCEGLRYNYVTKSVKEGKLQVTGNLIKENRNAMGRKPVGRKPATSRARTMERRNMPNKARTNRNRYGK